MEAKRNNVKVLIEEAYMRLLCKQDYLSISVSDLTKEAGVGRASYYRLFNSFDDIVEDIVTKFFQRAYAKIIPVVLDNSVEQWTDLIRFFCNYFYSGQDLITHIQPENLSFMVTRIGNKFNQIKIEQISPKEKYIALANMSMVMGLITYWINDGFKEPMDDIVNHLVPLIENNVHSSN